ncbi:MAG TPA: Zn-ribbon domain-containing OB-fold protein [Burkholderiales bacterium]|nr:Zn-ribbon domain-containing OB-fold protein [Burkholderiales bacterium]
MAATEKDTKMAEWFHPIVDTESEPFWKGCKEGKLVIKRCKDCSKVYYYPRRWCPNCWSENTEWIESKRRGKVYSYSTIHQNPAQPFASLVPYAVVLVDLDEGPRMMVNWDFAIPPDKIKCDMPVEIAFRDISEELALPIARPAK